MAINSNPSAESVVGGITSYSGITNAKVLAINPTMAELHAMEINVKTDPNYNVAIGDEQYNKLVFWLQSECDKKVTFRLEILMQDKPKMSKSGKYQWINNVGQSTWSLEAPTYEWWSDAGQRKAYTGEETLISFVRAWANVAAKGEASFDTIANIVKGDVTEIKTLVKAISATNMVRVLVGLKDDKYQQVYTKHFGRVKPQRDDLFIKALNDDYGSFNADFNADLQWGEHKSQATLVKPDSNDEWTESSDDDSDLPF